MDDPMTPRPLACAVVLSLIAGLAAPDADAAKRVAAKAKTPAASNACSDFYLPALRRCRHWGN
jgi:putative endopeptidase